MNADRPVPTDITHTTLSVLFLGLLIGTTFWVLSPFLMAILWAAIVTVATWPFLMTLEALCGGRRGPAVAIATTVLLVVVFVPVTLALVTIVRSATGITEEIRTLESIALPAPPAWIERVPIGGERMADRWRAFAALGPEDRSAVLTPYLQTALQWFAARAGSVATVLLQFLVTAVITAILFTKGEIVRDGILRFARRLAGRQGYEVAVLGGQAIRGVVLGVVVTAIIQAAIAGAGLFMTGVPAAALLTAMVLFLCLAQLGPILVLVPAVIWLYWAGHATSGSVLIVITIVTATLDNVVRPLLIKRGADLPLLLIFAGVIGGLLAMGVIGLFIGPVVLTIAYTLLKAWVAGEGGGSVAAAPDAKPSI
jgi:predicted PurR-regulated permease PerM